jgi:hypothetical protein
MFIRKLFPLKVARADRILDPVALRCHLHRCAWQNGVNDTNVIGRAGNNTAVSCAADSNFRGVLVLLLCIYISSLTMLCIQLCPRSSQIRSYIRKGFNQCIMGPGEVV